MRYTKTFTPEEWEKLDIVVQGLGYEKTVQKILEEKYDIVLETESETLNIPILKKRLKKLKEIETAKKLKEEILKLEHKQNNVLTEDQKTIAKLNQKIEKLQNKISYYKNQEWNLNYKIRTLSKKGKDLQRLFLSTVDPTIVFLRKEIQSYEF